MDKYTRLFAAAEKVTKAKRKLDKATQELEAAAQDIPGPATEPAPEPTAKGYPAAGTMIRTVEELKKLPGHVILRYTKNGWSDHETDGLGNVYTRNQNGRGPIAKRPASDLLNVGQASLEVQERTGSTCLIKDYQIQQKNPAF